VSQTSGRACRGAAGRAGCGATFVARMAVLVLAFHLVQATAASESRAFVPAPDRVADAVADANRVAGRHESLRLELTMAIAWENASSKFNRALRIPSQQLWKRRAEIEG